MYDIALIAWNSRRSNEGDVAAISDRQSSAGVDGTDPRTPTTGRVAGWITAFGSIIALSAGALLLRVALAYGLFRGSGFKPDVATFVSWAQSLATHGPGGFYANTPGADYPPGFLYVLWVIGSMGEAMSHLLGHGTVIFGGKAYTYDYVFDAAVLKLPAIAADILIGLVIYGVVRRWMSGRPKARTAALWAAALYLFNPVTWYDSALWGQVDAVGTLVVLCAVVLLIEGLSEGAVAATVLAGLIKPQYGVLLIAVVALILVRRHLFAVGSGPRPSLGNGRIRDQLADRQGPSRLASSAIVGAIVFMIVATPFGVDAPGLIRKMSVTAGEYPYLTVNANNPWALLGAGGHAAMAVSDPVGVTLPAATGDWSPDQIPLLGPLSGVAIGALLLAAAFLVALAQLAMRDSRRSILLTVAFLSLAFFILPTRVHERYAFPVFAILPLLAVRSRSFTIVTVVAAFAILANIHAVLTLPGMGTPDLTGLPFGDASRTLPLVLASVLALVGVFIYVLWRLRPVVDLIVMPVRRSVGLPARPEDRDPYDPE